MCLYSNENKQKYHIAFLKLDPDIKLDTNILFIFHCTCHQFHLPTAGINPYNGFNTVHLYIQFIVFERNP